MFCEKCGNQLQNTDVFCEKCGTPVQNNTGQGIINNIKNDFLSKLLLASGIIFFMQVILWFVGFVKVTDRKYSDFGEAYSMHSMFAKYEGITYVVVVLLILSAILCLKPVLKNLTNKYFRVVFQKIILILYTIWYTICYIFCISDDGVSITFGCVVNIILTIILHILLFKIGKMAKKNPKKYPDKYAPIPDDLSEQTN